MVTVVALLSACQAPTEPSGEHLTTDVPATSAISEGPTELEWKNAYLNYVESKKEETRLYALVYVDSDHIPELYLRGLSEAGGDCVCSYKSGRVIEQHLKRTGGGEYVERSGMMINQNGNMGRCYTDVYELTENGFIKTLSALSVERVEPIENGEYTFSYDYSVEDKTVSEDDYNAAIHAAFDFARAARFDENAVTYDEIKQQLTDRK